MERHNRITPSYPSISSHSNNSSSPYLSLNPKPHPPISSSYLRPQAETPRRLARRTEDTELSIFDAERYFNDNSVTDKKEITSIHRSSSISSVESYAKSYRSGYVATPTPTSEASWNSQSGLLSNPPGSMKVKMRSHSLREKPKMPSSPSRRVFSLRCPCVSKKSLAVDEKSSEPKSPVCGKSDARMSSVTNKLQGTQTDDDSLSSIVPLEELTKVRITSGSAWMKEKDFVHAPSTFTKKPPPPFQTEITRTISKNPRVFSFPNPPDINKPIKPMSSIEPPRESLEVFGTKPPKARIILKTDEEQLSDTSSDLFELDSFCANSYGTPSYGRRRDSLDDLLDPRRLVQIPAGLRRNSDEAAQSECGYPPSEVSIQWSVTTAEGFDRASVANFSSAASDFDELRFFQAEQVRLDKKKTVVSGGVIGNGLLSCRGEKAVQVTCNSAQLNRPVHMR
ncbi:hypothetical protein LUZ60_013202 [Juncus effusus]|nr:hypothetical protein LUZ60_013202 [Juncus effusus]